MNYRRTERYGIDAVIDKIQTRLYDQLDSLWSGRINGYPRVYVNPAGQELVVELYKGENQYEPILFAEENKFFFIQGNAPTFGLNNLMANQVSVVFLVNLAEILTGDERNDEKAHQDVISALQDILIIDSITGMEYGVQALSRLISSTFDGDFNYTDMQPYHVFFVRLQVQYEIINS